MANEFKIKNGLIVEGDITISGNIALSTGGATVDGVDLTAHVGAGGSVHAEATTSVAGFLSASDKTKLDGIADSANNYSFPGLSDESPSMVYTSGTGTGGKHTAYIATETITNTHISPSAAIATSKLADKDNFLLRGGTVALTANWSLGGTYTITNVPTPTLGHHVANKDYVDAVSAGFNLKDPVYVATTANITLSGEQTIDGKLTSSSRVLVKNQTNLYENGLYDSNSGAWTRTTDADNTPAGEVTLGMSVFVTDGDTQANSSWAINYAENIPITLGTDDITFALFARAGEIIAGDGLNKVGSTLSVKVDTTTIAINGSAQVSIATGYVGQTSITTLGTIGTGTWNADTIAANKGGTGQTTYAVGDILYASTTSALSKLADVATGNALISGGVGVAPSYGKIGLTTHITGTLAIANGGTGQTTKAAAFNALSPVTTLGDIIYGNGSNSNTRLAGNTTTTKMFLRQTGTGSASAAPAWEEITKTTVGLSNVENTALSTWAGSSNITTVGTLVGTSTWAGALIDGRYGGTGVDNAGKTITLGGNLTTSGAYAVTLTLSDTTKVTLPTTGTLATLAGSETLTNKTLTSPTVSGLYLSDSIITFEGSVNDTYEIDLVATNPTADRTISLPDASGTVALSTNNLSFFSGTTSAQLAGVITDETGYSSGAVLVFSISPALTGTPTAPTAAADTNTTQIATTAYVVGQGYLKSSTAASTYQPLDGDLTAIAALSDAGTGLLKKTGTNTWTLDTSTYLTANQTITLSGDVSGSGTNSIAVTIVNDAVEATMLNDNVISGQSELTTGLASTDELLVSDAGTIKRMDISVLEEYFDTKYVDIDGDTLQGDLNVNNNDLNNVGTVNFNSSLANTSFYTSYTHTGATKETVLDMPLANTKAIFFDYVASSSTDGAIRAGTFMVVTDSTNVTYTEVVTTDPGSSTDGYILVAEIATTNLRIAATAPAANWSIRGFIRASR